VAARLVPDIWETHRRVAELTLPILILHSERDELFPTTMAKRVARASGSRAVLCIFEDISHNQPLFAPTKDYWGRIAVWMADHAAIPSERTVPGG
jgi:pimeloyl-ACP methyl ester carboxylesterase